MAIDYEDIKNRAREAGLLPSQAMGIAGIAEAAALDAVKDELKNRPDVADSVRAAGTLGGVANYNPTKYPKTRLAVASARLGFGNSASVLCIGDSTTEGFGSAGTGVTNSLAGSWPRRMADKLTALGIKAGWQNFMGDHRADVQSTTLPAMDPRIALGVGWSAWSNMGIGGNPLTNNSTTNAITFTPTVNTSALDVYYLDGSGTGNLSILSGGSGATAPSAGGTITSTGSSKLLKATATYTLGANVWTIAKSSADGKNVYVQGAVAYDNSYPQLHILNCGCGSQATGAWTDSTTWFRSLAQITTSGTGLTPVCAVFMLGVNDARSTDWVSESSFYSTYNSLVQAYLAAGIELLLVCPVPADTASRPQSNQDSVRATIIKIAQENGLAYIDTSARWGSFSSALAAGYYSDSAVHCSAGGYGDIGSTVANFFAAL